MRRTLLTTIATVAALFSATAGANTIESALNDYNVGNFGSALEILQKLAGEGEPRAQYNLGAMYDIGKGVHEDNETAVKWYLSAAKQGNSSAAFNLGNMYREGQGVAKNYQEAVRWYQESANSGDASAQYNLGVMLENGYGHSKDLAGAVSLYQQAAKKGLVHAQHRLGKLSLAGEGIDKSQVRALDWFNKAARQGYQPAKEDLALLEGDIADKRRSVKGSKVNLRRKPSLKSSVLGKLKRGDQVLALAYEGEWVEVDVIGGKQRRGWIHGSLLK